MGEGGGTGFEERMGEWEKGQGHHQRRQQDGGMGEGRDDTKPGHQDTTTRGSDTPITQAHHVHTAEQRQASTYDTAYLPTHSLTSNIPPPLPLVAIREVTREEKSLLNTAEEAAGAGNTGTVDPHGGQGHRETL